MYHLLKNKTQTHIFALKSFSISIQVLYRKIASSY